MKTQDVMVALDLCREEAVNYSYAERAERLGMSASEVHAAVRRLGEARLWDFEAKRIRRKPFLEFLLHGVPYAFAASPGEVTRGMPTAWAAPVLADQFMQSNGLPPVWPHAEGGIKGVAIKPLYRSAVKASQQNPELYDLLALVDALRVGRSRERKIAENQLKNRLGYDGLARH